MLERFCNLLETIFNGHATAQSIMQHYGTDKLYKVEVHPGKRFDKIVKSDIHTKGGNVEYFVERSTGNIYGAKSWNAYNPARQYGTLDTIDDWNFGPYCCDDISKSGISSLVPKNQRR